MPGHPDAPELEIRREQVSEVTIGMLDSAMGKIFRRKIGKILGEGVMEPDLVPCMQVGTD